jgi:hypothetical protein
VPPPPHLRSPGSSSWSTEVFETTPSLETWPARCLFVIFPANQGGAAAVRFLSATAPPTPSTRTWRPSARNSPCHPWVREVWRRRGQGIASHAHPATYLPGVVAPATAEIMAAMLSTRASSTLKTLHLASFRHDMEDSLSSRQAPSPPTPRSVPCANPCPSVPALAHTARRRLRGWSHLQQSLFHQIPAYGEKGCKTT